MTQKDNKEVESAKIYVVGHSAKIDRILAELQSQCDGVDFIKGDTTLNIERIKGLKAGIDGILVFGAYLDRELGSIELPTIIVKDLWSWEKGIQHFYRNQRVLTACLSETDLSPSIFSARLDDLVGKIKLITALNRVKKSRMLDITHQKTIQPCDQRDSKPTDYDESYLDRLRGLFGLDVAKISFERLNREIKGIKAKEAEEVADRWISEAQKVRDTTRENIVKSAKMYLAIVELMREYAANAVTMSGWSGFADDKIDTFPCLGFTELSKKLVANNCESLIDALVTEMLGIYIMGRPGFVGDTVVDPLNGVIIWGHCKFPINPHGDDQVPYILRDHTGWPKGTGAGVQVESPLNETITAAKVSIYDRKISILTGETISGRSLYEGFDDILCRTKLVAKADTKAFLKNYDSGTFGIHKVVFYGDWRETFKNLATLTGFEVVEEDR